MIVPNGFLLAVAVLAAGGDVIARVDGSVITGAAFSRRLEAAAPGTRPDQLLETMIDEALLSKEGRRFGLERSPVATARLEATQRAHAGALLLEKEIAGRIAPDDDLLRSLFHSTADFAAFDLLTFGTAEGATAAVERIRKGASFTAEASRAVTSRVQTDPKATPLVMRGQLAPPMAAALFQAEPGAVVGPIQINEGFAVARLVRKVVGTDAEFAGKREAIVSHARRQLTEELKQHVLAQLRDRAHVTLDEAFLRSTDAVEPTPQQLEHVLATIGGRPLRYGEVFDTVRAIRATGGHMGAALRIAVAQREVDARLLQDAAVERGFLNAPDVVALRREHEDAAIGYAALMRIMDAAPAPTEDEIARFYERNSAAFKRPFAEVLAQAAAGAAREKREAAYFQAVTALRKKATISIDREALARAARPRA